MELWLLNNLSTLSTATVLVGGLVVLTLAGNVLVHRRFPSLAEGEHNDMVGVVLGMFGAIYGIILAFVVVTLWTQLQAADGVVANEASDLAQIVRTVRALPPDQQQRIETAIGDYAHTVVEVQWPLMREGRPDYAASQTQIDKIYTVLQAYEPKTESQKAFYAQTIERLNDVVAQRRARITQSQQELPLLLRCLVYGGALVMVPLTFLYGNKNGGVRLLFAGSVAALIGFSLLLVVVLDRPFAGDISVSPDAFKEGALAQFW